MGWRFIDRERVGKGGLEMRRRGFNGMRIDSGKENSKR